METGTCSSYSEGCHWREEGKALAKWETCVPSPDETSRTVLDPVTWARYLASTSRMGSRFLSAAYCRGAIQHFAWKVFPVEMGNKSQNSKRRMQAEIWRRERDEKRLLNIPLGHLLSPEFTKMVQACPFTEVFGWSWNHLFTLWIKIPRISGQISTTGPARHFQLDASLPKRGDFWPNGQCESHHRMRPQEQPYSGIFSSYCRGTIQAFVNAKLLTVRGIVWC